MDCIDLSILKCLKENSRQTASMISQTINLSVSAVIERIRKLEAKGLIRQMERERGEAEKAREAEGETQVDNDKDEHDE